MTTRRKDKPRQWKVWVLIEGATLLDVSVNPDKKMALDFLGPVRGSHKMEAAALTLLPPKGKAGK